MSESYLILTSKERFNKDFGKLTKREAIFFLLAFFEPKLIKLYFSEKEAYEILKVLYLKKKIIDNGTYLTIQDYLNRLFMRE